MTSKSILPEDQARALLALDDAALRQQLGLQLSAMYTDPARSLQPAPHPQAMAAMAPITLPPWVPAAVEALVNRAAEELEKVLCSADPKYLDLRNKLINATGLGQIALVEAVTVFLAGPLGITLRSPGSWPRSSSRRWASRRSTPGSRRPARHWGRGEPRRLARPPGERTSAEARKPIRPGRNSVLHANGYDLVSYGRPEKSVLDRLRKVCYRSRSKGGPALSWTCPLERRPARLREETPIRRRGCQTRARLGFGQLFCL
jgi:hypothetical protein